MLNKEEKQMLQEARDTSLELKVVLLGKGSDTGLVGRIDALANGHSKLKRIVYTLIGILVGSGIIGGSIAGLLSGG